MSDQGLSLKDAVPPNSSKWFFFNHMCPIQRESTQTLNDREQQLGAIADQKEYEKKKQFYP